ncbi:MAG: hypothetical protein RL521_1307 [Bacteroidota bacterium]
MNYSFKEESAMDLGSLRFLVLWPHKLGMEECLLDVDFKAGTRHFAARNHLNEVVACCTMVLESKEIEAEVYGVRLRAMATHPNIRGKGAGKELLLYAMSKFKDAKFWCDAREVAVPFYLKCGWNVRSEPYDIPIIGKHFLMSK